MTIEDQLRDALHARGDALRVPPQELVDGAPRGTVLPRALVAAVAVVVLGLALLLGRHTSEPHVSTGPTRTTNPTTTTTTTDPPTSTDALLQLGWYDEEDGVWALDAAGQRIRLPAGGDLAIAADRRTVLLTPHRADGAVPGSLVAHDVRTGAERDVGPAGLVAVAVDGQLAVANRGDQPEVDITIRDPETYELTKRIALGPRTQVFGVWALAWDADRAHLLAVTWDTETQMRWWRIDVAHGTVQELDVPADMNPGQHGSLFVGRATGEVGDFPVLAGRGWGTLHVADDGSTSFEHGAPYGLTVPPEGATAIVPVGRVAVQRLDGGRFSLGPGDEEAYLVVSVTGNPLLDHFALWLQTASGSRTRLLDDVRWVVAP